MKTRGKLIWGFAVGAALALGVWLWLPAGSSARARPDVRSLQPVATQVVPSAAVLHGPPQGSSEPVPVGLRPVGGSSPRKPAVSVDDAMAVAHQLLNTEGALEFLSDGLERTYRERFGPFYKKFGVQPEAQLTFEALLTERRHQELNLMLTQKPTNMRETALSLLQVQTRFRDDVTKQLGPTFLSSWEEYNRATSPAPVDSDSGPSPSDRAAAAPAGEADQGPGKLPSPAS